MINTHCSMRELLERGTPRVWSGVACTRQSLTPTPQAQTLSESSVEDSSAWMISVPPSFQIFRPVAMETCDKDRLDVHIACTRMCWAHLEVQSLIKNPEYMCGQHSVKCWAHITSFQIYSPRRMIKPEHQDKWNETEIAALTHVAGCDQHILRWSPQCRGDVLQKSIPGFVSLLQALTHTPVGTPFPMTLSRVVPACLSCLCPLATSLLAARHKQGSPGLIHLTQLCLQPFHLEQPSCLLPECHVPSHTLLSNF